jgi:hypothetical protein
MDGAGAFQYTREYLAEVETEARELVVQLGGNVVLESILDKFSLGLDE